MDEHQRAKLVRKLTKLERVIDGIDLTPLRRYLNERSVEMLNAVKAYEEGEYKCDPTVGEVVEAYFKTEDEIKKISAEAEEKIKPLEKFQELRKQFCGKLLTEQQGQNIKTAAGTAFFKKQEFVNVADWDTFVEKELLGPMVEALINANKTLDAGESLTTKGFSALLKESFPYELLNKAVNKTAVLEIMGEKRENVPPAGINYVSKQVVQIHRK